MRCLLSRKRPNESRPLFFGHRKYYYKYQFNPIQPVEDIHLRSNVRGELSTNNEIRYIQLFLAIAVLRDVFERNTTTQPFDFFFLDDDFNALYRKERRTGEIFGAFAIVAVIIACLGLLGLAAFAVERRTKEIGIRKVLGASAPQLALRLGREFLGLVLVANAVAWPIAYYAMSRWLQDFAYRIGLGVWPFLLAAAGALVFAFLTVSTQTFRAAAADPVETLRYE